MAEAVKVGLPVDVRSLGVTDSIKQLVTKTVRGDQIRSGTVNFKITTCVKVCKIDTTCI